MKEYLRRATAWMLTFMMLFSCLPTNALAAIVQEASSSNQLFAGARSIVPDNTNNYDTYMFVVGDTTVSTQIIKSGDELYAPATPEKAGYKFMHWAKDGVEFTGFGEITSITGGVEITLTAVFEQVYYVFFMDGTGSDARVIATKEGDNGAVIAADATFAVDAEESITGWYTDTALANKVDNVTIDGANITLYPKVETGHWITFDSVGGTYIEPAFVKADANTVAPANPTRAGYSFAGWQNGDKEFSFGSRITENITLTANWDPNDDTQYTIIYWIENADDEEYTYESMDTGTGTTGDTITLNQNQLATSHIDSDYRAYFTYERYDTGKTIAEDGSTIVNVYFSRNEYTLTFRTGNNANSNVATITAKYNAQISDEFEKAPFTTTYNGLAWECTDDDIFGYALQTLDRMPGTNATFKLYNKSSNTLKTIYYYTENIGANISHNSWPSSTSGFTLLKEIDTYFNYATYEEEYHEIEGFTRYSASIAGFNNSNSRKDFSNNRLYLYYLRNSYDLVFQNVNAVAKTESVEYEADLTDYFSYVPAKPADSIVPANYVFEGWYTTPACEDGTEASKVLDKMPLGGVVVYAKWAAPTFEGTIHLTMAGTGDTETITITYGSTINEEELEQYIPEIPDGYVWRGWATKDGDVYTPFNFETKIYQDITLYPYYTSVTPFSVTYDENGGSGTAPVDSKKYADQAYADIQSGAGLTTDEDDIVFLYWNTEAGGRGTTYYPGDKVQITGNLTLYAIYGEKPAGTTLVYHGKGGTIDGTSAGATTKTTTHVNNEAITLESADLFKMTGYKIIGWSTSEEATSVDFNCGATARIDTTDAVDGVNHLYAVWAKDESQTKTVSYTVEYYKDGVKVEADTVTKTATVWVLDNTLPLQEEINTADDKYGAEYKLEKTDPETLPALDSEVTNGTVFKVYYIRATNTLTITKTVKDSTFDKDTTKSFTFTIEGPSDYGENGKATQTITVTSDGSNSNSNSIALTVPTGTYTITETTVDEYAVNNSEQETEVTKSSAGDVTFINTRKNSGHKVEATKVWEDASNQDGKRPAPADFVLTLNGILQGDEYTLTQVETGNEWTYTWTGLEEYDADGVKINYTVSEPTVPSGYTSSVNGFTVTNSYTPEKTQLTVTKEWSDNNNQDGIRPDSVTVKLCANNAATDKTVTLSESNNWSYTFTDLDVYTAGQVGDKVEYTVREMNGNDPIDPNGTLTSGLKHTDRGSYTVTYGSTTEVKDGDGNLTGYAVTVTNTHVVETSELTVKKTWVGDHDKASTMRPSTVCIDLYAKYTDDVGTTHYVTFTNGTPQTVSTETSFTQVKFWPSTNWSEHEHTTNVDSSGNELNYPTYAFGYPLEYYAKECEKYTENGIDKIAGRSDAIYKVKDDDATKDASGDWLLAVTNTLDTAQLVIEKVLAADSIEPEDEQAFTLKYSVNGSSTQTTLSAVYDSETDKFTIANSTLTLPIGTTVTVVEDETPGWTPSYSLDGTLQTVTNNGQTVNATSATATVGTHSKLTVTNTYDTGVNTITAQKVWVAPVGTTLPTTAVIKLYRKIGTDGPYELVSGKTWTVYEETAPTTTQLSTTTTYTFEGLEEYAPNGDPYYYAIKETTIPTGYTTTMDTVNTGEAAYVTVELNDTGTITNRADALDDKVSVQVTKNWDIPDYVKDTIGSATFALERKIASDADYTPVSGKTFTVAARDNHTEPWDELDKYDANGNLYLYQVVETFDDPRFAADEVKDVSFTDGAGSVTFENVYKRAEANALSISKTVTDNTVGDDSSNETFTIRVYRHDQTDDAGLTLVTDANYTVFEGATKIGSGNTGAEGTVTLEHGQKAVFTDTLAIGEYEAVETFTGNKAYVWNVTISDPVTLETTGTKSITVTNERVKADTAAVFKKTWVDSNDALKLRPDAAEFEQMLSVSFGSTFASAIADADATITENGSNWTIQYINLPKYDLNGTECIYTMKEDLEVAYTLSDNTTSATLSDWYFADKTTVVADGTITNTLKTIGENGITVTKEIAGYEALMVNNDTFTITVTLPVGPVYTNNVTATPTDITATLNGNVITLTGMGHDDTVTITGVTGVLPAGTYSISETGAAAGNVFTYAAPTYTPASAAIDVNGTQAFKVTNTPETTETVTGTKTWVDGNNAEGLRPTDLTLKLYKTTKGAAATESDWTEFTADYIWENKDTGVWTYTYVNLPEYEMVDGVKTELTYKVKEVVPTPYKLTASDDRNFTNTINPDAKVNVNVTKTWDVPTGTTEYPEVTFNLLKDGIKVDDETLTSPDTTVSFNGLTKYDQDGRAYVYTVTEDSVPGYTTTSPVTSTSTEPTTRNVTIDYAFTNEYATEKKSVTVEKVWQDKNGEKVVTGVPASVTITVTGRNAIDTENTTTDFVLTSGNQYKQTNSDMLKYLTDGSLAEYSAAENTVPSGYELVSIVPSQDETTKNDTFTVTNKYTGGTPVSITVKKQWVAPIGTTLPKATLTLYRSTNANATTGEVVGTFETELTETTTETGTMPVETHTFSGLESIAPSGELYHYFVVETFAQNQSGFTAENNNTNKITLTEVKDADGKVTGKTGEKTITNKSDLLDDTLDVTVTKTWDDDSNYANIRPSKQTFWVKLTGNSAVTPTEYIVQDKAAAEGAEAVQMWNGEHQWTYMFDDAVRKYDDQGNIINYTVSEYFAANYTAASANTESITPANGDNAVTLTNSYTPDVVTVTVTKVWEDNENEMGIRPASVTAVLKNNNGDPDRSVVLNADNKWSASWTVKEFKKNSTTIKITYTIEESDLNSDGKLPSLDTVNGRTYTVKAEKTDDAGYAWKITNTHDVAADKSDIVVTKLWKNGTNPDTAPVNAVVKVKLQKSTDNGKSYDDVSESEATMIIDNGTYKCTWEDQNKYEKVGDVWVVLKYRVVETQAPTGWVIVEPDGVEVDSNYSATITNNRAKSEADDYPVKKIWSPTDDADKFGVKVTVMRKANGVEEEFKDVTLTTEDTNWTEYLGAVETHDVNGNPYEYYIKDNSETYANEADAAKLDWYTDTYNGLTVTNTRKTTSATVIKNLPKGNADGDKFQFEYFIDGVSQGTFWLDGTTTSHKIENLNVGDKLTVKEIMTTETNGTTEVEYYTVNYGEHKNQANTEAVIANLSETAASNKIIVTNTREAVTSMTLEKIVSDPDHNVNKAFNFKYRVNGGDWKPVTRTDAQDAVKLTDGLYVGDKVEIAEIEDADYVFPAEATGGVKTQSTIDGVKVTLITIDQLAENNVVVFTNTRKTSGLTVSKTVTKPANTGINGTATGDAVDSDASTEFTFTLKKNGIAEAGAAYSIGNEALKTNANGEFKLKDGETAVFTALEVGDYTVTEQDESDWTVVGESKKSVTVATGKTASAAFTNKRDTVDLADPIQKIWKDSGNDYKTRPESVTLQVVGKVGDKTVYTANVILENTDERDSDTNTWERLLTGLPKTHGGVDITYTAAEKHVPVPATGVDVVDGTVYVKSESGMTVTNTLAGKTDSLEFTKKWDDQNNIYNRRPTPEAFKAMLQLKGNDSTTIKGYNADGAEVMYTMKVEESSAPNEFTITFTNLPLYTLNGVKYEYTLSEKLTGNTASWYGNLDDITRVSWTAGGEPTITELSNSLKVADITVTKKLIDSTDNANDQTFAITATYDYAHEPVAGESEGTSVTETQILKTENLPKDGTITFTDIPVGGTLNVSEEAIAGYTVKYYVDTEAESENETKADAFAQTTVNSDIAVVVENTRNTTKREVQKQWENVANVIKPTTVTLSLYAKYTVTAAGEDGGESTSVDKWLVKSGTTVTIANEKTAFVTVDLESDLKNEFINLPTHTKAGELITYTVEETMVEVEGSVDDYKDIYTMNPTEVDGENSKVFTNTRKDIADNNNGLKITKTIDNGDRAVTETMKQDKFSFTVTMPADMNGGVMRYKVTNGNDVSSTAQAVEETDVPFGGNTFMVSNIQHDQTVTLIGLVVNGALKPLLTGTYSVEEDATAGNTFTYTQDITAAQTLTEATVEASFTAKNTVNTDTVNIHKNWQQPNGGGYDVTPYVGGTKQSVADVKATLALMKGNKVLVSYEATSANNMTVTFDVPKDGVEYTVVELSQTGANYEASSQAIKVKWNGTGFDTTDAKGNPLDTISNNLKHTDTSNGALTITKDIQWQSTADKANVTFDIGYAYKLPDNTGVTGTITVSYNAEKDEYTYSSNDNQNTVKNVLIDIPYGTTVTITESPNAAWKPSMSNVTVTEVEGAGIAGTVTTDATNDEVVVTNTRVLLNPDKPEGEQGKIKVIKKWSPANVAKPSSLSAQLLWNGVAKETKAFDVNWTVVFTDLPAYDLSGEPYTYSVLEAKSATDTYGDKSVITLNAKKADESTYSLYSYDVAIAGSQSSGEFTVTNTYKEPTKPTKTADAVNGNLGQVIKYTIERVSTYNVETAATITDTLPKGLTYNADLKVYVAAQSGEYVEVSGATVTPSAVTDGEVTISVTGVSVPKLGKVKVEYTATVNVDAIRSEGSLENDVAVQLGNEPNGDFQATEKTVDSPVLSIAKNVVGSTTVRTNDTVTYEIIVTNSGNAPAKNVKIVDKIPEGLNEIKVNGESTPMDANRLVEIEIASVPAGDSETVTITATVTALTGTIAKNLVTITEENGTPTYPDDPDAPKNPEESDDPFKDESEELEVKNPKLTITKSATDTSGETDLATKVFNFVLTSTERKDLTGVKYTKSSSSDVAYLDEDGSFTLKDGESITLELPIDVETGIDTIYTIDEDEAAWNLTYTNAVAVEGNDQKATVTFNDDANASTEIEVTATNVRKLINEDPKDPDDAKKDDGKLKVTKVWKEANGNTLTDHIGAETVTVYLYRTTTPDDAESYQQILDSDKSPLKLELTLGKSWTDEFSKLPATDATGNPYTYAVKEVDDAGAVKNHNDSDAKFTTETAGDIFFTVTIDQDSTSDGYTITNKLKNREDDPDTPDEPEDKPKTEKTADKDKAQINEVVTYTITERNPYGSTATATVIDEMPEGLAYMLGSAKVTVTYNGNKTVYSSDESATPDELKGYVPAEDETAVELDKLTWSSIEVPPMAEVTVEFKAVVTEAAVQYNELENTATISRKDNHETAFETDDDTEDVIPLKPALELTKDANAGQVVVPGETFNYTLTLENTGDGRATGTVVTDELPEQVTFNGFVNIPEGTEAVEKNGVIAWTVPVIEAGAEIEAGTAMTLEFTVKVKTEAVDGESVTDEPKLEGDDQTIVNTAKIETQLIPDEDADEETTPIARTKVEKTALVLNPDYTVKADQSSASLNDIIRFKVVVTNIGGCDLTNVVIEDKMLGMAIFDSEVLEPIDAFSLISGRDADGSNKYVVPELKQGYQVAVTYDYQVVEGDILVDVIANTATATATTPDNDEIVHEDSTETKTDDPAPALGIVKTITSTAKNGDGAYRLGETIEYLFTVTNTGNVTVSGLALTDKLHTVTSEVTTNELTEAIKLEKDVLAPGESTTATYSYTVKPIDLLPPYEEDGVTVAKHWINNMGTVTGTAPVDKDAEGKIIEGAVTADSNTVTAEAKQMHTTIFIDSLTNEVVETITYPYGGNVPVPEGPQHPGWHFLWWTAFQQTDVRMDQIVYSVHERKTLPILDADIPLAGGYISNVGDCFD